MQITTTDNQLVIQQPASTQPAIGEEAKFLEVIKETPINKTDEKEISEALKYAFVKIGLKQKDFPVPLEKQVLLNHLVTYYGNHTPNEIRLAFDLAMTGALDLPNRDANCYGNFSCYYLSTIMNAYRIWAVQVHRQHSETKPVMKEDKESLSDSAMLAWLMDLKTRNYSVEFMPPSLYDWCRKNKIFNLTPAIKLDYLVKAGAYYKAQLIKACEADQRAYPELKAFNKLLEEGIPAKGKEADLLYRLAKQMILHDYVYQGKNANTFDEIANQPHSVNDAGEPGL